MREKGGVAVCVGGGRVGGGGNARPNCIPYPSNFPPTPTMTIILYIISPQKDKRKQERKVQQKMRPFLQLCGNCPICGRVGPLTKGSRAGEACLCGVKQIAGDKVEVLSRALRRAVEDGGS